MGTNVKSNGRSLESQLQLWRKRFQEYSSESCTVDQFCKQVGITPATFYYWRKKLADRDVVRPSSLRSASGRPDSISSQSRPEVKAAAHFESFVPVRIARAVEVNSEVVVRLPSGAQVLIPTSAAEVISAVIAQVCRLNAAPLIEAV